MDNNPKLLPVKQKRPSVNGKIIAEKKREKYRKKQAKKLEYERKIQQKDAWFKKYSRHSTLLDDAIVTEVKALKRSLASDGATNSHGHEHGHGHERRKRPRIIIDSSSCSSNCGDDDDDDDDDDDKRKRLLVLLDLIRPYMDLKDSSGKDVMGSSHGGEDGEEMILHEDDTEGPTKLQHSAQVVNTKRTMKAKDRYFIAEGTETVRMLIEQSAKGQRRCDTNSDADAHADADSDCLLQLLQPVKIHSILTKPSSFFEEPVNLRKSLETSFSLCTRNTGGKYIEHKDNGNLKSSPLSTSVISTHGSLPFHVLVGAENTLNEIVGYPVARGAMACGRVPALYDEQWLYNYISRRLERSSQSPSQESSSSNIRILALDKIDDTANLGSIIRSSAAFGIHVIVLSADSCDVWYRRCVRVSMGHVLTVPSVRVDDLSSTIVNLREKFQIVSYAAVIDPDAEMILEHTKRGGIHRNWCCVLGNEGNGISPKVVSACDQRIRIDMTESVDSLSVGVAAGIIMHGMREREARS